VVDCDVDDQVAAATEVDVLEHQVAPHIYIVYWWALSTNSAPFEKKIKHKLGRGVLRVYSDLRAEVGMPRPYPAVSPSRLDMRAGVVAPTPPTAQARGPKRGLGSSNGGMSPGSPKSPSRVLQPIRTEWLVSLVRSLSLLHSSLGVKCCSRPPMSCSRPS